MTDSLTLLGNSVTKLEFIEYVLSEYSSLPGVVVCEINFPLTPEEKSHLQNDIKFKHLQFEWHDETFSANKPAVILKSIKQENDYGLTLSVYSDGSVEQQLKIPKTLDTNIIQTEQNIFSLPASCHEADLFICIDKHISPNKKQEIEAYIASRPKNKVTILYEIDTDVDEKKDWEQMIAVSTLAKKNNFNRRGIFIGVGNQRIQNIIGLTARTFRRGASSLYYPLSVTDFENALRLTPRVMINDHTRAIPFYPASLIVTEPAINDSLGNASLTEKLDDFMSVREISNSLDPDNDDLISACQGNKLLVVIDKNFYEAHQDALDFYFQNNASLQKKEVRIIFQEGGDENKNQIALINILSAAQSMGIDRDSGSILAMGGGVVLDTVGAAAALLDTHYVRIPTTLLGVIDAAVGIKTGINLNAKNDFGAFYKPRAVFYDLAYLQTESLRNIRSGLAEMIKIFIVTDKDSFDVLEQHYQDFINKNFNSYTSRLIVSSIYDMLHQLQPNIYEDRTLERLADFGHEIGHILEFKSHYRLLHGEAVSLGMAIASTMAFKRGLLPEAELNRILILLNNIGLPIVDELFDDQYLNYMIDRMEDAKANKGGDSAVVVPSKTVGDGDFIRDITKTEFIEAYHYLQRMENSLDMQQNQLNTEAQASIVFDVGGTNLRCGVYKSNSELVFEQRLPTPSIKSMPGASLPEIQTKLIADIKRYIQDAKRAFPDEELSQVIISFAGTLDKGIVLKGASLWGEASNIPLQAMLEKNIPGIKFTLINDVIAAAWRYGSAPEFSAMHRICIFTLSTGIGAAYFDIGEQNQDKEVISIGHKKKFDGPHSLQCDCGEFGHLEPYVSGRGSLHQIIRTALNSIPVAKEHANFMKSALYKNAKEKLLKLSIDARSQIIQDPYIQKMLQERGIDLQLLEHYLKGNFNAIPSDQFQAIESTAIALVIDNYLLTTSINKKDKFTQSIFDEIVKYLGEEIYEIASSNTDKIILMGGFARAIKPRLEAAFVEACKQHNMDPKRVEQLFCWAEDDDNDGILGAAYFGDQPRRLWSLFHRIIADKARLQKAKLPIDENTLRKAFDLAYTYHTYHPKQPQYRYRSDEPARYFIWHPVELVADVINKTESTETDLLAATFLHDVLEYTTLTQEQLATLIGQHAVNIAYDLSQASQILSMSIPKLNDMGFDTDAIATLLGYDINRLDESQIKTIANIATKIEHYARLLDHPLDARSQWLKILDNNNNYSSVDRLQPSEVKLRTVVELLLFKIYVDQVGPDKKIKKEAYDYISKLLKVFNYPSLDNIQMKQLEHQIKNMLFNPWRNRNNKISVQVNDNKLMHGQDINQACEKLSQLKNRNFKIANEKKNNPNVLPISKNKFLLQLFVAYEKNKEDIGILAKATFDDIKSEAKIGEYGRFASVISEVELILAGDTIIYFPKGKNPGNLPAKKFIDTATGKPNPIISALSGSKELWLEYIDEKGLDEVISKFYEKHRLEIDEFLSDKQFIDRFDSFYSPDRMVPLSVTMPDGTLQELCLFESNASQMNGGQFMFVSPSGMQSEGYVENIIGRAALLSKMIDYKQLTGYFPPSFQRLEASTQKVVEKMQTGHRRRGSTLSSPAMTMFLYSGARVRSQSNPDPIEAQAFFDKETSKQFAQRLTVDVEKKFSMDAAGNGELAFLVASSLNSSYAVFQNSVDTASVPMHYHCYAIRKDKLLTHNGEAHSIPLFKTKPEKEIYEHHSAHGSFLLEKMQWPGACYHLKVPVSNNVKDYDVVVNYIKYLQDYVRQLIPAGEKESCTLSFIINRTDDHIEFYAAIRKRIYQNPTPNSIAQENGLQSPFNGGLEFAGINTMSSEDEYKKHLALIDKKGKTEADDIFNLIQSTSLMMSKPDDATLKKFEEHAANFTPDLKHSLTPSSGPRTP